MAIDYKALGEKATAVGTDMTKSVAGGGGDYTPPPTGPCRLRFIGYVEVGKQKGTMKGVPTVKDKVQIIFELHGKNYPPHVADDGTKTPMRITVEENYSLNEKAHFFKLFQRMNYKGDATHMAQLLGQGYKGEVLHDKWTGTDGKERVTATLKGDSGYTIAPPRVEDDEAEGGWKYLEVPPAISAIRCFIWNIADLEQWTSLFIDGEYPAREAVAATTTSPAKKAIAAKSKNVFQAKIKQAVNFQGSPIHALLAASGANLDIPDMGEEDEAKPDTEAAPKAEAPKPTANDALAGIV